MTVILANPFFWATGTLEVPGDFGARITIDFKARFKRLKTSERKLLNERIIQRTITDEQVLDDVLCDWELTNLQGEKIIYTPAARKDAFEETDGLEAAFCKAFFDAFKEPEKNSVAPSATT